MDGLADDFMIDEDGELVPIDPEEWVPTAPPQMVVAHATITQYDGGVAVMQVFGSPSREMLTTLQQAMRGLMVAMTQH